MGVALGEGVSLGRPGVWLAVAVAGRGVGLSVAVSVAARAVAVSLALATVGPGVALASSAIVGRDSERVHAARTRATNRKRILRAFIVSGLILYQKLDCAQQHWYARKSSPKVIFCRLRSARHSCISLLRV